MRNFSRRGFVAGLALVVAWTGSALAQLAQTGAGSTVSSGAVWILATGLWNDSGVWDNTAVWID